LGSQVEVRPRYRGSVDAVIYPREKIAADLRAAIYDGRLAPGAVISSANKLADAYGTTRNTVRRAFDLLEDEGLIELRQGAPPRVRIMPVVTVWGDGADWQRHREARRPGFDATVTEHGLTPRQEILDVKDPISAPAHVAAKLGLHGDDPMVVMRYVRQFANEIPSRLVRMWFPAAWASGTALAGRKRIRGGVAGYIEDPAGPISRRIAKSRVLVGGRSSATQDEKPLLERGVSVLEVTRVFLDEHGEPVFVQQEVADATRNRYSFEVTL
jgi:GntR family transcriptional regulator